MRHVSTHLKREGLALAVMLTILAPHATNHSASAAGAGAKQPPAKVNETRSKPARPATGVVVNHPGAFEGYTLVFPLSSTKTYLIDMQGRVVRMWQSKYMAGQDAYLLENGNLLRAADLDADEAFFAGASKGGRIQEFTWEGDLVWDYRFHNQSQVRHHAITQMPNGNVMMIVWERKTAQQAMAAGVKPVLAGKKDVLVDALIEIKPTGKTSGKIVWEWRMWDHLIQDHDSSKPNFGDVAAHPELIDVNFARQPGGGFTGFFPAPPPPKKDEPKKASNDGKKPKGDNLDRLKGIGYIGAGGGRGAGGVRRFDGYFADWAHVNAVAYDVRLDQIMLSPREFNEVWIIDHSTTRAEAAGHQGGRHGKGGDILYRWGNPRAYRAGTAQDQKLFLQHDTHWIPAGLPGAGNLLVFSNGGGRKDGTYSSVDEVVLPVDQEGRYARKPGSAFGPSAPVWTYTAPKKSDFFAIFMSGAQRLRNGNTLISTGFGGTIFEVTPQREVVWKYIVPIDFKPGRGTMMFFGGAGNPVFRAYLYAPDYPGLVKRDLTPGKTIDELQLKDVPAK
jgi:hypothetical protein